MVENKLENLAGSNMIIVRAWHISLFTAFVAFFTLYIFFEVFQPSTLFSPDDFVVGLNSDGVIVGNTKSDEDKSNKYFSDDGRVILLAWSLGLGVLVGLVVHLIIVYAK